MIEKQRKIIENIDSTIEMFEKQRGLILEEIKNQIEKGERSSDLIKDFLTYNFGIWDNKTERSYKNLDEKIKNNSGEPILVIKANMTEKPLFEVKYINDSTNKQNNIMSPNKATRTEVNYVFQMGIIPKNSSLEFNINRGEIIIPTEKHLYSEYVNRSAVELTHLKWNNQDGKIINHFSQLSHLNKENILPANLFHIAEHISRYSDIQIGKEVKKYFSSFFRGNFAYSSAIGMLSKQGLT